MKNVKIGICKWDDFYPKAIPLLQEGFAEKGFKEHLDVAHEIYQLTEKFKSLILAVAWYEDEPVGVVIFFLSPNFGLKTSLIATQNVWYVKKEFRRSTVGVALMLLGLDEAKRRGAKLIQTHFRHDNERQNRAMNRLMHRFGARLCQSTYEIEVN